MYAICSTKKEDVSKCLHEMMERGMKLPIFQFGATKYKELEKNHSKVMNACRKVQGEAKYVINLNTFKVHKKTCPNKGSNVVSARLASLHTTGLIMCKNCMR